MRPRKWSGLDTHADPETSRARQGAGGRSPAEARHRLPGRPTPSGEERRGARPRPLKTPEHRLSPQRRSTVRKRGLYFRASLKEGGAGWVLLACGGRRDQLHRRRQVALTGELGAGLLGCAGRESGLLRRARSPPAEDAPRPHASLPQGPGALAARSVSARLPALYLSSAGRVLCSAPCLGGGLPPEFLRLRLQPAGKER